MPRRLRKTEKLLRSTAEAHAAMWITLAVRVPQILSGTMTGAERTRMVREKVDALGESIGATSRAATRLACDPAALMSPAAVASHLLTLAAVGSRPYHTRVKANARRLSRKRPDRSG